MWHYIAAVRCEIQNSKIIYFVASVYYKNQKVFPYFRSNASVVYRSPSVVGLSLAYYGPGGCFSISPDGGDTLHH